MYRQFIPEAKIYGGKIYVLSNAVAARIQSLSQRFRYIQKAVHQALVILPRVAMKTKDVAKI